MTARGASGLVASVLAGLLLAGCGWNQGGAMDTVPPVVVQGRGDLDTVADCIRKELAAAKARREECEKPYEHWVLYRAETEWSFLCDMSDYYRTRPLAGSFAANIHGVDADGLKVIFGMRLRKLEGDRLESFQWVLWHLTAVPGRQRVLRDAFARCAAPT